MGSLNEQQLARARTYINSNRDSRNPISLLMELGQLLHIFPEFNTREHEMSTVHQRVFVCEVRFAQFRKSADGYSKKRVKNEAANCMIEFLRLSPPSSCLSRGGREFETARTSANLVRAFCNCSKNNLLHTNSNNSQNRSIQHYSHRYQNQ